VGWKSDWLYHIIFREVERVWAHTRREGEGTYGPAPDRFYIQQHSEYTSTSLLLCSGYILRLWSFDGSEFTLLPHEKSGIYDTTIRGMFYIEGSIRFHITNDRKNVIWNAWFGPRYARGKAFCVIGQGKKATLEKATAFMEWIS
jgi:hypothetical protein